MANADFVDKVNSYVRQSLQDHIAKVRPHEKIRRYSSLLLSIRLLYGINCKMVENLFCRHVLQDEETMETMLRNMLESYPDEDEEEDTTATSSSSSLSASSQQ